VSALLEGTATTYTAYMTVASDATDSQVSYPTITFRVNLETLNRQGHLVPNRTVTTGNETVSEADNMKNNRTIYIPGLLVGENKTGLGGINQDVYLHHNDEFTVKGEKATYLKNLYVSTPAATDDLLVIVSES
jgi:hypothetical protein